MPVLSPHRTSSSSLSGAYRSPLGSSALDRSFYGSSSSYSPRYSFSERYTSKSYTDSDGRRIFSRSGSITEDGVTTRFREETREGSLRRDSISRDSGISSIQENSVLDVQRRERDPSVTRSEIGVGRESRYTTINVAESLADLRNKYSPANYVPAVYRNKEHISRSKSINDIGLPPIGQQSAATAGGDTKSSRKKVTSDILSYDNCSLGLSEFANNTNNGHDGDDNMYVAEDDNGNRQPVSELRKRFENQDTLKTKSPVVDCNGTKSSESRYKKFSERSPKGKRAENGEVGENRSLKLSKLETSSDKSDVDRLSTVAKSVDRKSSACGDANDIVIDGKTKLAVSDDIIEPSKNGSGIRRGAQDVGAGVTVNGNDLSNSRLSEDITQAAGRVNNFSSYISSNDFEKGDVNGVIEDSDTYERDVSVGTDQNDLENGVGNRTRGILDKDLNTSPHFGRALSQNTPLASCNSISNNIPTSNSYIGRSSTDRDDDRFYDSRKYSSSPIKQQGLNGLKNIGNTCFMNSVIQCLSNTKPLLEYLRNDSYTSDINTTNSGMKGALIKAFAQVIKELWSEDASDRVVNTVSLKSQIQRFAPRFMGYSQQDAQEFLRYLLEGLHEDVNRVTTKPTPIHMEIEEKLSDIEKSKESWQRYLRMDNSKIVDIFVGQLKSTLRCTHCGHCSVTFDPFWDLSLPIPQKVGPVRLQQCLESFTREETLDGDEKPTCSKCKERRKCTKSLSIQKFPKILVIHLKRFSPTERFRGKLSVNIDFPLENLDMSNYAADNITQCRYNLYAVSNHSGTTYSGHYTAYCRHPYSHSWHEYNDSRVSSISSKSIVSGEAYVLFYEQDDQKSRL